jgi:cytochrome c2
MLTASLRIGMLRMMGGAAALLLPALLSGHPAYAAGDAEAGRTAFNRRCGACHAVAAGQNKVGPSLHDVVGRTSAQVQGFNYSPALRGANKTWDEATLHQWLQNPRGLIPGNRMIMPGITDSTERDNIIAYLAAQH